ncbi:hypothetical protein BofuT4_uP097550.1 [Botrytis cinerea T4]|uniref:Uncharacterized protein n=1 Tax=Botryotinia fuckeliana (strain T4) TaxID=999810 RepID=G2YCZ9_BOTF4|nr:hypothetical protein BofuT4_uP097550.1 [Botrytis cinerea T4]
MVPILIVPLAYLMTMANSLSIVHSHSEREQEYMA